MAPQGHSAPIRSVFARLARFAAWMLVVPALGGALFWLLGYDLDGDGSLDSIGVGSVHLHIFVTRPENAFRRPGAAYRQEKAILLGRDHREVLASALSTNDFVLEFLHRNDPDEFERVRSATLAIVGEGESDRSRVERLLDWLSREWDFGVEHSIVNAAELLSIRGGSCETCGFVVGALDSIGIGARMVGGSGSGDRPSIAVEAWLDGAWRWIEVSSGGRVHDESWLDVYSGAEFDACIVYYWRDSSGFPFERAGKLWYDERVEPLFVGREGLPAGSVPTLANLRISG